MWTATKHIVNRTLKHVYKPHNFAFCTSCQCIMLLGIRWRVLYNWQCTTKANWDQDSITYNILTHKESYLEYHTFSKLISNCFLKKRPNKYSIAKSFLFLLWWFDGTHTCQISWLVAESHFHRLEEIIPIHLPLFWMVHYFSNITNLDKCTCFNACCICYYNINPKTWSCHTFYAKCTISNA